MDEPIRIFSDLHLAHPGCRIRSVEQLTPLFEGAGTVIFNGDTTEQRHAELAAEGAQRLSELKALLGGMGIDSLFLRGNHDPEISEIDYWELAGGGVLITHGDALFRHLSPWSPKVWKVVAQMEALRSEFGEEKLAADLSTALECAHRCRYLPAAADLDVTSKGSFPRVRSFSRLVWPPLRPLRILKTWLTIPDHAHDFAERYRPEARLLLFGHTHFPGVWSRGERVAINTGGFMSVMPARGIEIANGELVVRMIDERGERYALGKEVARVEIEAPLQ